MKTKPETLTDFVNSAQFFEDHIRTLAIGHRRYEKVRKMNPRQFQELYNKCTETGQRFDFLVDGMED